VERCHHRDAEGSGKVQDVRAVLAAPNASAVLDADHFHAAVVEGVGRGRVIGLGVAPDSVANLSRVRPRLTDGVKGYDLPLADSGGQVVRERSDAALPGGIGGDESSPRDQLAPSVGPTVSAAPGLDAANKLICPCRGGTLARPKYSAARGDERSGRECPTWTQAALT
jgi:hypothetical protein